MISSESSRVVESSQATTKRKGTTGNALDSEIKSDCHDKINAVVSKDDGQSEIRCRDTYSTWM